MKVLVDMSDEQGGTLGAVTEMLVAVDQTISQLMAVRDGILALGSRVARDIGADAVASLHAEEGTGVHPTVSSRDAEVMELAGRAVAAEFAAALRVSDRTVQRRMGEAEVLVSMFPAVWRAQGSGRISPAHVRAIIDAGSHLDDDEARAAYAEQMVEFAATTSPGRTARMGRRVAERFQARTITDRHRAARRSRRVWATDRPDGMAVLGILGPAALIHGAYDRLTALGLTVTADARAHAQANDAAAGSASAADTRCLDEVRADIALDMLLTGTAVGHDPQGLFAGIRGTVSVTVPVTTLMGTGTTPAELNGRTPIDAETARILAGTAAGWDRVFTHPITGGVLAVDRYRPSAELKRWLLTRDQHCRFPGCGYPARDCDLDHTRDHADGGPTTAENLGALCRRHHVTKHQTPWTVEQLDGGVFAWTSPTGRVYLDNPPPPNTTTNPRAGAGNDDDDPPF